ncbi:MAG: hypothetical protein ACYC35_15825 [Pirellulales bacterium]
MTMVDEPRNLMSGQAVRRAGVAGSVAKVVLAYLSMAMPLAAQVSPTHYRHSGVTPPGAIGSWQLQRGGPLPGYFQPVEIKAPKGALISLAAQGAFDRPQATPARVGLLISPVYRMRVTNIPLHEGVEVFPTLEVIDRLYPPAGQEHRFPIPVELTQEELELAIAGKFVTRVVYLEDPENALPVAENPQSQEWFDAGPGTNPVEVADQFGRPVAILRLGARLPDNPEQPDPSFLYGCPPFVKYAAAGAAKQPSATKRPPAVPRKTLAVPTKSSTVPSKPPVAPSRLNTAPRPNPIEAEPPLPPSPEEPIQP